VYYVLGNHDRRVDFQRLNSALADAGLIHLGGQRQTITVRDATLLLAGNELPWFKPVADFSGPPPSAIDPPPSLRIVLAHTPDQFHWAQQHNFDLMLAGHNHGGQVCLPFIGPILAPSLHGVRYAAGVFRAGNTVMHVSRGTSGLTPIRFNCPPEIAILVLRQGK
jgi:predicted MPP superfamily phosphohydrolase